MLLRWWSSLFGRMVTPVSLRRRRREPSTGSAMLLETRELLTVSVSDAVLGEPATGQAQMMFTLTRTGDLSQPLGVGYQTQDGTAVAGVDYVAQSGVAQFAVNSATTQVSVPILSDGNFDPGETFALQLTGLVDVPPAFQPASSFGVDTGPTSIAVADFNGDGKQDLLVGHVLFNAVSVLLNTTPVGGTTASFSAKQDQLISGRPDAVAAGDLNGDGKPDLAVATAYGGDVAVLLNATATGSSTVSFPDGARFPIASGPAKLELVDMNADGKLDLVSIGNSNNIAVRVNTTPLGSLTFSFAATQVFVGPTSGPKSLTVSDFNGDGKPDVASSSQYGQMVSVLLNSTVAGSGTVTFQPKLDLPEGNLAHHADSGDLNGDGKPDLVVSSFNDYDVSVFTNTTPTAATTPSFATRIRLSTSKRPEGVLLSDVTDDGKLDIIVANFKENGNTILVFRNTTATVGGTPTFAPFVSFVVGSLPNWVSDGDFNGDGHVDLAVSNNTGNSVSVLLSRVEVLGDATAIGSISERPILANLGPAVTYVAGSAPVILADSVTAADGENNFANSSLSVQVTNGALTDRLSIVSGNGVTAANGQVSVGGVAVGSYSGGTGTTALSIQFNNLAAQADVQAVLRQIGFSSDAPNPTLLNRNVQFVLTDGTNAVSDAASKTCKVSSVPSITNLGGDVEWTLGAAPAILAGNAVANDGGNNFANSQLSVQLTNGEATDQLSIVPGSGVTLDGSDVSVNGTLVGSFAGGDGTTALVVTFGNAAKQGQVQAVLRRIGFSSTTEVPTLFDRNAQFILTDGKSFASAPVSKTCSVSNAPSITGLGGTVTWSVGNVPAIVAGQAVPHDGGDNFANSSLSVQLTNGSGTDRLSIVAGNGVTLDSGDVSVDGTVVGTFGGGAGTTALVIQFNNSAMQLSVQAVLRQIGFSSVSVAPGTFNRSARFVLTDGTNAASQPVSKFCNVANQPAIVNLGADVVWTAGSAPAILAQSAIPYDGGGNFANSQLSIQLTNGAGTDQLTVVPGGGVMVNGSSLSVNGAVVGSFSGGAGTTALVLTFGNTATQGQVQSVLRRIGFSSTSTGPALFDRNVEFILTDGTNAASAPVAKTCSVSSAPAIVNLGGLVTWTVGTAPAIVANQAVPHDGGNDFANSALSAQLTNGSSTDRLSIVPGNGVTTANGEVSVGGVVMGMFGGGSGTTALAIQFNNSATQAAVQAVLRQIGFSSVSLTPGTFNRAAQFVLTDGTNLASAPASKTCKVSNTPAIANLGGNVNWLAGSAPVLLATQAVPGDGGNNFANSQLSVQMTNGEGTDLLSIVPGSGVTLNGSDVSLNGATVGSFAGGAGTTALVVTFGNAATQGQVQAVLRRIGFSSTSTGPSLFGRNVQFILVDGTNAASTPVAKTASVYPAPAISNLGNNVGWTIGGPPVIVAGQAIANDGGGDFANSKLSVRLTNGEAADRLIIVDGNGVTAADGSVSYGDDVVATYSGGDGQTALVIEFNFLATQESVQAVLRQIGFYSTSATPSLFDRNVQFTPTDGTNVVGLPVSKKIILS